MTVEEHIPSVISRLRDYMPVKEISYSINISRKYRYVFVENPKVACGTVKKTLQALEFGRLIETPNVHDRTQSPLLSISELNENEAESAFTAGEYFMFSFARNPFTRALSAYKNKIENKTKHKKSILRALGKDANDLSQLVTFKEFLRAILIQDPYDMDNHWRPQNRQLFMPFLRYDLIGRFESFERDFANILNRIVPNSNMVTISERSYATRSSHVISRYYDSEAIELVRSIYEEDFSIFGYDRQPRF